MASTLASTPSSVHSMPLPGNIRLSIIPTEDAPFIGCENKSRIRYVNTIDHRLILSAAPSPSSVPSTSAGTIMATTHPATTASATAATTTADTEFQYPLFVLLFLQLGTYMPRNDNIKNFSDRLNEVKFDDFLSKVSNRNENEQKENAFQCGIFYDPYLMNGKNKQNKPIYKDLNNFKLLNEDDNLHKQKFNNFESENTCQEDDVMQKMSDRFDSLFFDEDTQFA